MIRRIANSLRFLLAVTAAATFSVHVSRARAQSCFVSDFFPMDNNWVGPGSSAGLIPVDPNPNDGIRQIETIQVDTDGNGSADTTFPLPVEAQDAVNYFLSPARTFILATVCPNIAGCASNPPNNSATIALVRLGAGGVATIVHTDCLGGGVLNGNGKWYEGGLCLPDPISLPVRRVCTTSPALQVNAAGCNRLFMARSVDASGNAELHWYDLNNTSPDPTDGRGITLLRRQTNDPDLTIDIGGNAAFCRHNIASGATTYDAAVIDVCPGSPLFGENLTDIPELRDLSAASGVVRARIAACPTGVVQVEVFRSILSGDEVVHSLMLARCDSCLSNPPPTGRCCTTSSCSVTTLANCASGADGWTSGGTCSTTCPPPAPVLSLRIIGAASAPAGQPVTIALVAQNTGTAPGVNVRIQFNLNRFYYMSMTADNSGVVSASDVRWTLGTLAPGETRVVHATFRPVCLTSSPIPIRATLLFNIGTANAVNPYDLIITRPPAPGLGGFLISIPSTDPLVPGSTVTHTLTLTNPASTPIFAASFNVTLGSGMMFDTAINAGGGTFSPSGFNGLVWTGDLAAQSTTVISFRALVQPCPNAVLRATQFNEPVRVTVVSACSEMLVDLGLGARFSLIPTPLAIEFMAMPGPSVGIGSGLTGAGNIDILIRDGAVADVTLRLTNRGTNPESVHARIPFGTVLDPAVAPLGPGAPPGAQYDDASGLLTVDAELAPNQALDVPIRLALASSQACRATVTARGGVGPCTGSNANAISPSLTLHRVYPEPAGDHLVTFDYIDGLYTFRPGVDTQLQRLLCFGFSGGGSGAIARTSAGQVILTSPPALFDPAALVVRPLPALSQSPLAIAWDSVTATLVIEFSSGGGSTRLDRLDIASGTVSPLVVAGTNFSPNGGAEGLAIGGDGRLLWLAGSTRELRMADPRPPATLPLSPADSIVIPFLAGFVPIALTTDSAGDYIIIATHSAGQRVALARVDHGSLAVTLVATDIGPRSSIPTTCTAALGTSDVCFGSVLPGSLVRVNLGPPVSVFPNTLTGFPGVLDMTVAHGAPPRCLTDVDDGSGTGTPDGGVTIDDLLYFLDQYTQGTLRADIDDGSGTGTPDGGVTIDDLLFFVVRFEAGC